MLFPCQTDDSDQNKITETNDDGETILAKSKDILDLKTGQAPLDRNKNKFDFLFKY